MKKLLALLVCFGLVSAMSIGLVGCDKGTTKKTDKDKTTGAKDKKDHKLEVSADPKKVEMKPGGEAKAELTLERGKDTPKEVKLAVAVEPKDAGVDAKTDAKTEEKTAKLTITAKAEAKEQEYTITVTASAKDSTDATTKVTVTVKKEAAEKKKDEKLSAVVDHKSITVKQGDKGTVKLTVTLGEDLKKGAKVKVWVKDEKDKEAKGVTAKAEHDMLKESGDDKVTVTVAADAMVADYELYIETSAEGATPDKIERKVTVKVEKK